MNELSREFKPALVSVAFSAFLLVVGGSLLACKDTVSDAADAARDVGDNIEDASKNVEHAAGELRKGLEGFDAVGLREVLRDNKELRAELEAVLAKLDETFKVGRVSLAPRSRVIFEVNKVVGDLTLSGWVGSPGEKRAIFLNDQPFSSRGPLKLKWSEGMIEEACTHYKKRKRDCGIGRWEDYEDILDHGVLVSQLQVDRFYGRSFPRSSPEDWQFDLQLRLPASGTYPLWLDVTPDRADQGKWELHYTVFVTKPDSTSKEKVLSGALRSEKNPGHPIGSSFQQHLGDLVVYVPTMTAGPLDAPNPAAPTDRKASLSGR